MGFKKNLPDSLELLLDTMCNTFGGIMFIAISLIVISQLVSQQQKAMSQEDLSKAAMERLKQKIESVQNENAKLRKLALNVTISTANISQDKKDAVIRMKEIKEKNLQLEDSFERLDIKQQEHLESKKHLEKMIDTLTKEITLTRKNLLSEKQKSQQEKIILENKIKELTDKLKNLQQPTLRFAKLKSTAREPYWVIFQQNKLYRFGDQEFPLKGEVELKLSKLTNTVTFKPLSGTAIGNVPEEELTFLFKNVDKNKYFISILSDSESFSSLMLTKQFLRNHNFLCDWSINPLYKLSVSTNVQYSAAE